MMDKDKVVELKIMWCDLDRQIRGHQVQLEQLQKQLALVARKLHMAEQEKRGEEKEAREEVKEKVGPTFPLKKRKKS